MITEGEKIEQQPAVDVGSTDLLGDPVSELLQLIKESGATLKFWMCPERGHRGVAWKNGVATCNECGRQSPNREV